MERQQKAKELLPKVIAMAEGDLQKAIYSFHKAIEVSIVSQESSKSILLAGVHNELESTLNSLKTGGL